MATFPIAKLLPALELNPGNRSQNLAEITGSVKGLIFALAPPPVTLCASYDEKRLSSRICFSPFLPQFLSNLEPTLCTCVAAEAEVDV